MKIYNKEKTKVLESPNRDLGYLISDKLIIHHDAVEGVQEQGHYNVIAEYPNGGKDVEWVVDVPGVEAKEAYDEEEDILVYIPFTEKELHDMKVNTRIKELKDLLLKTDYQAIKYAEGVLTEEQYASVKADRQSWRDEINKLQESI